MAGERPVEKGGYKFIKAKSGRLLTLMDVTRYAEAGYTDFVRSVSRMVKLSTHDWDIETLERQIERMEDYCKAVREVIVAKRKVQAQKERIAKMRNVNGRTKDEAAEFLRKADELEAALPTE